jgi:site-specific DNA recombinase
MGNVDAGQGRDREVLRIDAYARISFALSGDTIKTDDQIEMAEEDIPRRGFELGETFRDDSLSAWNPKVRRLKWEQMMRRLETGESDGVWVYDLTRFSRKPIEGERLIEAAQRGARVLSRSMEYDLTTADGRSAFRDAMNKAATESDKISERVKRGKKRRARKGHHAGGQRGYGMPGLEAKPKGWQKGDPRVSVPAERVEAEREVIREGYRRLLGGETATSVVRQLRARGVCGVNGRPFTVPHFVTMLRRATVAGLLHHNGEVVGALVDVEPIVSREEWERLCAILDARKPGRPSGPKHVLAGVMFCGVCGQSMKGQLRSRLGSYPDGSPRREYRCRVSEDGYGCGGNSIDARVAEQLVGDAVKAALSDPRRAERVAARSAVIGKERARINADIERLTEDTRVLATKTKKWGVERVDLAMEPLLAHIEELEAQKARLGEPESVSVVAADVAREWDEAIASGNLAQARAMVKAAFPYLTLSERVGRLDHRPERFDWQGNMLPNRTRRIPLRVPA